MKIIAICGFFCSLGLMAMEPKNKRTAPLTNPTKRACVQSTTGQLVAKPATANQEFAHVLHKLLTEDRPTEHTEKKVAHWLTAIWNAIDLTPKQKEAMTTIGISADKDFDTASYSDGDKSASSNVQ